MTHKEAFRRYAIANIGKIRKRQEIREAVEQIRNDALTMDVSDFALPEATKSRSNNPVLFERMERGVYLVK